MGQGLAWADVTPVRLLAKALPLPEENLGEAKFKGLGVVTVLGAVISGITNLPYINSLKNG
ncbi:hypothetical protein YWA314_14052 [Yersinia enterocolitica subsp. enterocolitica WA-314]|nr:hypothetical protein YWA314_14052 [Yersinia enterocolitica subsp. enterocolitica WA-314]